MKKNRIILSLLALTMSLVTLAQVKGYQYQQELLDVKDEWHTLNIPPNVLSKSKAGLGDIRILGITAANDTLTAPYFVDILSPSSSIVETPLQIINRSRRTSADFITLKANSTRAINVIKLNFGGDNFDYKLKLEGSSDNSQWYTILDSYRVLSIASSSQNYSYTDLTFPSAEYKYYRISIPKEATMPGITNANMLLRADTEEAINSYTSSIQNQTITKKNITELSVTLEEAVPISLLQLSTKYSSDFIRTIRISALVDSFKTEKGWKESYAAIYSGSFTSFETHTYSIRNIKTNKLKIEIINDENSPITIDAVRVMGYKRMLTARFDQPAKYFLYYGNPKANKPRYDIELFKDKIPKNLKAIGLAQPKQLIDTPKKKDEEASKIWLWVAMGIVMVLLGAFTLNMMRKTA